MKSFEVFTSNCKNHIVYFQFFPRKFCKLRKTCVVKFKYVYHQKYEPTLPFGHETIFQIFNFDSLGIKNDAKVDFNAQKHGQQR